MRKIPTNNHAPYAISIFSFRCLFKAVAPTEGRFGSLSSGAIDNFPFRRRFRSLWRFRSIGFWSEMRDLGWSELISHQGTDELHSGASNLEIIMRWTYAVDPPVCSVFCASSLLRLLEPNLQFIMLLMFIVLAAQLGLDITCFQWQLRLPSRPEKFVILQIWSSSKGCF